MAGTSIISMQRGIRVAVPLQRPWAASGQLPRKFALIIPTLCEAENLPPLLERVAAALGSYDLEYEVLVVDDNSGDGTIGVVADAARRDPRVRLLVRKDESGLAGAVLYGWENTDAEIVGVMDADLQHPPEVLPGLVEAVLGGCDIAIGSRYAAGGGLCGWNLMRRLVSGAAVYATWPIQRMGLRAKDPMSGFFVVRRACLSGIPFQQTGFKLLLEILVRARIASIREIPISFGRRFRGSSKASGKIALEFCRLLARLYWSRFGFGADLRPGIIPLRYF